MKKNLSTNTYAIVISLLLLTQASAFGQWIELSEISIGKSEIKDFHSVIKYKVDKAVVSKENPAYIFIRYRLENNAEWSLLPEDGVQGDGIGIIAKSGKSKIHIPLSQDLTSNSVCKVEFQVRGIAVREVPQGEFVMKSVPGNGYNESLLEGGPRSLPTFYMAKFETTLSMYSDFLNETGKEGKGWNENMTNETTCGILREGNHPNFSYKVVTGREKYPLTSVTWFSAKEFLNWCGLRLPSEAEWEKAITGGKYLDGDILKKKPNPIPDRIYPWGNEDPEIGDVSKCNMDGDTDGYDFTAPVGSFQLDKSPYGIYDLSGNVAEWTIDYYTNRFLDDTGYRVLRGGSWIAFPEGVDAVTQATSQPIEDSPMIGFRGAKGGAVDP